jgi:hypothetical protein
MGRMQVWVGRASGRNHSIKGALMGKGGAMEGIALPELEWFGSARLINLEGER